MSDKDLDELKHDLDEAFSDSDFESVSDLLHLGKDFDDDDDDDENAYGNGYSGDGFYADEEE